ncbi:MAG: response regulator receiver:transcriptional regulatory protein-like protein [uncultured bacterium]|nr:MAG: response regulator receiver:transcriptional regulatory protein-like protein [uncultured bacterium]
MKAALYDIWKTLTPAEQKLLTNVILNEVKNLDPSVVSIPQDDKQNNYLQNVGLFKNNKFTIPLFEQFIKKEISQTIPQAKQKIAFDLNTHDITKGELVLSDTLTPSEFKLLRYLVQNPNKIIEREEIINIVWANTKSTAGVTDQALDQLIFRVRKKIEDDPNNPEHLQTVKGRGFRFLP